MTEAADRDRLAALHGVDVTYRPSPDREVRVPDGTVVAVLAALGVDASTPAAVRNALAEHDHRAGRRLLPRSVVMRRGRPLRHRLPEGTGLRLTTEDGGEATWDGGTPLPVGRHVLRAQAPDGRTAQAQLVVAPERLPGPPERVLGFMAQLYSVLSSRSWGMGDLGDLADLAAWTGRALHAGFLQVNPLHVAVPGHPTDPSPYRPSSRRFPDPVYLRVEEIPEYAYLGPDDRERAADLLRKAAVLRDSVLLKDALIDRDAVWELKREALALVRKVPLSPGRRAAYCDFLADQGQALDDHATWSMLAELHGPQWRGWPAGLRDPRSGQVARLRGERLDQVDFHCWLAWLTDAQLAAAQRSARDAGMAVGIVHDLAVGVHPSGSDAWALQDALAHGMSVGAPPDAFNAHGQDWGLPPWRPDALAATGYAPYRDLLRNVLRHAGACASTM